MRKHLLRFSTMAAFGLLIAACSHDSPTPIAPRAPAESPPAHDPSVCNFLIGDYVWQDLDADGCQDAGEPGLPSVKVILRDSDTGKELARTRSDENGWFRFENLCPGTYQVETSCPKGCEPTRVEACSPERDSNPNPTTVRLGDCDDTIDFGFICKTQDEPKNEDCDECEGKVSELMLRYTGTSAARITVNQKHPALEVFRGMVAPGEAFTVTGRDKKGTLGTEIRIYLDGKEGARIHTSCSRPIGPGLVAGDFEIVAGRSREGGPLCPLSPKD